MGKLHHCIYAYSIPHSSAFFNSFFELGGSFCRFLSSYPDGVEDQIRICHTNTVTSEHYLFSVSGGVLANFYLHTPMGKKIRFKPATPIQSHLNIIFFSVSGEVFANFYLHTPMVKKIRFKSTVPIQRHLNIIFLSFFGSKVRLSTAHRYHAILPWHKSFISYFRCCPRWF